MQDTRSSNGGGCLYRGSETGGVSHSKSSLHTDRNPEMKQRKKAPLKLGRLGKAHITANSNLYRLHVTCFDWQLASRLSTRTEDPSTSLPVKEVT